jgi:hypothetical protein
VKPCNRCDKWLSDSRFYRDARNSDGLSGMCKCCQRESSQRSSRERYVVKGTMSQRRDECGRWAA